MSNSLVVNSSNVIGSNNNTYQYKFIQGSFQAKDCEMAIGSATIPYSWYNISALYGNNKMTINFPYLATTYTMNITFPDGFYTTTDINNYIQLQCLNNGLYLTFGGQNYFFISLSSNTNYYTNQFVFSLVPTTVASGAYAGYSVPATGYWSASFGLPTVTSTPYVTFPATSSIGSVLGFSAGIYPTAPYTTNQTSQSNLTPNGSIVNGIIIRCNLLDNNITMPSDILDCVPINAQFGSNITYDPSYAKWIKIKDGIYSSMTITLTDQNFNTIYARDPNLIITLMIRQRSFIT